MLFTPTDRGVAHPRPEPGFGHPGATGREDKAIMVLTIEDHPTTAIPVSQL